MFFLEIKEHLVGEIIRTDDVFSWRRPRAVHSLRPSFGWSRFFRHVCAARTVQIDSHQAPLIFAVSASRYMGNRSLKIARLAWQISWPHQSLGLCQHMDEKKTTGDCHPASHEGFAASPWSVWSRHMRFSYRIYRVTPSYHPF